MIYHIQMAVAMVDATRCTLKRRGLLPGQKEWIKRVLEWNGGVYKFLYYEGEDYKFVIKVKSLKPYKSEMTCAEMIDSLNEEVDKSDRLIVKTDMTIFKTGEPFTNEKTMRELTEDIRKSLQYAGVEIYLHSDSGNFTYFKVEVEDKAKIAAPPKTKTADSPFRPRRKLSKRDKKSFSKSAQKRRKSKKRSAKPRRR